MGDKIAMVIRPSGRHCAKLCRQNNANQRNHIFTALPDPVLIPHSACHTEGFFAVQSEFQGAQDLLKGRKRRVFTYSSDVNIVESLEEESQFAIHFFARPDTGKAKVFA